MTQAPFIKRVALRNYKSIGYCDVRLRPLTYLVGHNGAGKSNFMDALHFVIAAARSLDGCRGFCYPDEAPVDAETPRDAKGWLRRNMESGTYSEVLDQPAFTAQFDLQQAFDNSRSFRKLCKEWQANVVNVDGN
ncbi:MAG TPA: AAA family ATPase [Longimicrobium sp.]|nr:AAA family ATPase [Longimicrobium sp.]